MSLAARAKGGFEQAFESPAICSTHLFQTRYSATIPAARRRLVPSCVAC